MNLLRFALLLPVLASAAWAAKWDPVSPAELAAGGPAMDPDAPAEAIFRRIEVDESGLPRPRTVTEYVRYRIFDPEKATDLTRVSQQSIAVDGNELTGNIEMSARLTLPSGVIHEFGKESIREKAVVRRGAEQSWLQRLVGPTGVDVQEKFLAVTGIEKGAILEILTSHTEGVQPPWTYSAMLQQAGAPTRRLEFVYHWASDSDNWRFRPFTLNTQQTGAQVLPDTRHNLVRIVVRDLPALYREPFSIPQTDYALTFIATYTPANQTFIAKHGTAAHYSVDPRKMPWGNYATKMYMFEQDRALVSRLVKRTAATVTAGAADDDAKARLIHQYVQTLRRRYLAVPKATLNAGTSGELDSVDDVITFEKRPVRITPPDFVFLEVALDRAIGLQANTVMLPNVRISEFDERMVAESFLPVIALRVKTGDRWVVSFPNSVGPLPFGALPWPAEGQEGLVALPAQQVFFPVPSPKADYSKIINQGDFELAPDGGLSGSGKRVYTGHPADIERELIRRMNRQRQMKHFAQRLGADCKGATVTISQIKGVTDPEVPLEVTYSVDWPDFALATKNRLIFHPSVFHFTQSSPFTASVRRYDFQFPYRWQESDQLTLALPAGYALEAKEAPGSIPGDSLDYRCSISEERDTKKLHYSRQFTSNVLTASAKDYGAIRGWYQGVAQRDQFELVLHHDAAASEAAPAAP